MKTKRRTMRFSGDLYPATCGELKPLFDRYNHFLEENLLNLAVFKVAPRAILAPYGHYDQVGFGINFAMRLLSQNQALTTLLFLTPLAAAAHPLSCSDVTSYELPAREISADVALRAQLLSHGSHLEELEKLPYISELYLPAVSYHFKERPISILECFYSPQAQETLSPILEEIRGNFRVGIIMTENCQTHDPSPLPLQLLRSLDPRLEALQLYEDPTSKYASFAYLLGDATCA